jgi:hypothetical protein
MRLTLNVGLGVNVPFYSRLRESGYKKKLTCACTTMLSPSSSYS